MSDPAELRVTSPTRGMFVATCLISIPLGVVIVGARVPWMFAMYIVASLAIAIQAWRMSAVINATGITVCNGFRTRRIPWPEIADVEWLRKWPWGPAVVLTLKNGESVALAVTHGPSALAGRSLAAGPSHWLDRIRSYRPHT